MPRLIIVFLIFLLTGCRSVSPFLPGESWSDARKRIGRDKRVVVLEMKGYDAVVVGDRNSSSDCGSGGYVYYLLVDREGTILSVSRVHSQVTWGDWL